MKILALAFCSLSFFHPTFADEIGHLKITPDSMSPVVVETDLVLNPGTDEETTILGPWFTNSYAIDCDDCGESFTVDTLIVTAICLTTGDSTEYKAPVSTDIGKGRRGKGINTGSAYYDNLPSCEAADLSIEVEAIGYDVSGKYLAGTADHGAQL